MSPTSIPIRPAATVMLLRELDGQMEVLMLKRNKDLVFAGGCWVFPGGRIDENDYQGNDNHEPGIAARHAAVRETAEETGIEISSEQLIEFDHWTTPPYYPKRYATTYFTTRIAGDQVITIDGSEIVDFAWMVPHTVLEQHELGKMPMLTPTIHTLRELSEHSSIDSYFRLISRRCKEQQSDYHS